MSDAPLSDEPQRTVLSVLFYHRHQRVFATTLDTRLEIGRQRSGEPAPRRRINRSDHARIVLAPMTTWIFRGRIYRSSP